MLVREIFNGALQEHGQAAAVAAIADVEVAADQHGLRREDCIHFIASDAHNTSSRPLKLRDAFDKVAEYKGQQVAQALFVDNPLAAFEGRQLPYVPDINVGAALSAESENKQKRRKRFWFF